MPGRSRARLNVDSINLGWQIYTKCKVCERRICINNYPDHKVRLRRRKGVIACPWCSERLLEMYIITRDLAKAEDKAIIKALRKRAKKLFGQA